jgi:ABC-type transporter Mla subunit MlaD
MTGDELDRAIQFLVESQGKLTSDIAQLTGDVAQLTGDVTQLTGDVTELRGDLAHLTDWMGRFAQTTQLFAERADRRLELLETGAERTNGRQERLDTAMAELAERMSALIRVVEGHVADETRHRTPPR